MSRPRQDDDTPTDEESDGTTFVNPDSDDESDSSTDVDSDIFSDRSDEDTDDEASLFDEEEQHPPEYYLAESASLDASRLRQRRYSPKIQGRLDWVKEHWDRYEDIQNAGTQTDLLTFSP
jgi:hypothetical protein